MGGWFAKEPEVFVDEGGLRCLVEGVPHYVAFARIRQTALVPSLIGRSSLQVVTVDGLELETPVPSSVETSSLQTLVMERTRQARATMRAAAARRGDLATWIASVTASHLAHQSGDAYRARSLDTEALEVILADPSAEIEARAAAAHALMKVGCGDIVARIVKITSPPMVLVAVRLAKGGEKVVTDAMLAEALPFLELRDRVVFDQRCRVA